MARIVAVIGLVFGGIFLTASTTAVAAPSANPSITIVSPRNGAIVHGSSLTVSVHVSHFHLVAPVLKNPPVLTGAAGHIHYVLDNMSTFSADRDVSVAQSHTWTNIAPGRHTLIAYLATSQHVPFPTAKLAQVTVMLQAPASASKSPAPGSPGIHSAPTTGGGATVAIQTHSSSLNVSLLLAALLALFVGLAFLRPRLFFATLSWRGARKEPTAKLSQGPNTSPPFLEQDNRVVDGGNRPTVLPDGGIITEAQSLWNRNGRPAQGDSGTREALASAEAIQRSTAMEVSFGQTSVSTPVAMDSTPLGEVQVETNLLRGTIAGDEMEEASFVESQDAVKGDQLPLPAQNGSRQQLIEMARQWVGVVEGLVQQLETEEAQRAQMLQRISALEEAVGKDASLMQSLVKTSREDMTASELAAIQSVADRLAGDPDHISTLAVVAQNAESLHTVVRNYASMYHTLEGTGRNT